MAVSAAAWWSKNDTDETIAQTKANNAVYKATC